MLCRFQAILSIQEGVSVFRVVETNDFNQLPHITLAFRPGSDAAVKSFLAGRLSEVRASHASLERDLGRAQVGWLAFAPCPLACMQAMPGGGCIWGFCSLLTFCHCRKSMKASKSQFQYSIECRTQCLQAEASSRAEQLRDTKEQLAEAVAAHERHAIEVEARSKSQAADAVMQKSEELSQQKEDLDRYTLP